MFINDGEDTANNPFKEETAEAVENCEENKEETIEQATTDDAAQEVSKDGEQLKNALDALNNKYIRLAADFDNFRKRQMQERENLLKYGAEETLKKLITVLDNFERAEKSVEQTEDCQTVKESYDVCIKQMYDTLEKIGLTRINAAGEEFDPNLHEAVVQTPTNEHPHHTIIAELQTGYKLHDKVIRPAMVNVASNDE